MAVAPEELALLLGALDAYEDWRLGGVLPRDDGMVRVPGGSLGPVDRYWEDEEPVQVDAIEAVRECCRLAERLRSAMTAI